MYEWTDLGKLFFAMFIAFGGAYIYLKAEAHRKFKKTKKNKNPDIKTTNTNQGD